MRNIVYHLPMFQDTSSTTGHLAGDYTICVRREEGMCVIGYIPPKVVRTYLSFVGCPKYLEYSFFQVSTEPYGFSLNGGAASTEGRSCLLYTSDAADE